MSNPLNIDAIFTQITSLIGTVSDVVNVYDYKVSFNDEADFTSKFQSADKTKFTGWDMYRVAKATDFSAFNKYRHVHAIAIRGWLGVKDVASNITYKKIRHILENVQTVLNNNLTLNGTVQNSEPASLGEIVEEMVAGRLLWVGTIIMNIEEGQIFSASVS